MPALALLSMPAQDLHRHTHPSAPLRSSHRSVAMRWAVFGPALMTTTALLAAFAEWMAPGGLMAIELVVIALVGLSFIWISLYVSAATLGLLSHMRLFQKSVKMATGQQADRPLDIALLIPVYNEDTASVFGNAAAMAAALNASYTNHRFSFHFLSDTRDDRIATQELQALAALRIKLPPALQAFYRRRRENTDKKSGNIANWVQNWGGAYDAMLVLDADSLMSAEAMIQLADHMSSDEQIGLVQSQPELYSAESVLARMQQFAGTTYGALLSEGLALWTGHESNFWGHNALIRVSAFAQSAGLPKIRGLWHRQRLILSHDIVEAALLRRAGWKLHFLPTIKGSYEEAPVTMVDFCLRDRRWCHGNMQHLRLIGSKGLHWVSRFHMLHGAMGYLMSPVWFALVLFWALLGNGEDANPIHYFSADNPLYPQWPEFSSVSSLSLLCFMYVMLLLPKLMGTVFIALKPGGIQQYGGIANFLLSLICEVIVSIAYAPILMVQQTLSVAYSFIGIEAKWKPQQRGGSQVTWQALSRFHAAETVTGLLLLTGISLGIVSLWLLPIMISLVLAVPLSRLSGMRPARARSAVRHIMATPLERHPPSIITEAAQQRQSFSHLLNTSPTATNRKAGRKTVTGQVQSPS